MAILSIICDVSWC